MPDPGNDGDATEKEGAHRPPYPVARAEQRLAVSGERADDQQVADQRRRREDIAAAAEYAARRVQCGRVGARRDERGAGSVAEHPRQTVRITAQALGQERPPVAGDLEAEVDAAVAEDLAARRAAEAEDLHPTKREEPTRSMRVARRACAPAKIRVSCGSHSSVAPSATVACWSTRASMPGLQYQRVAAGVVINACEPVARSNLIRSSSPPTMPAGGCST